MIDTYLLQHLLPVEIAISLFAIVAGYFIIRLPSSFKMKFLLIPLLVVGSFFIFSWFEKTLGFPVHMTLNEQVILLKHRVATNSDNKKQIELWILPIEDRSRSRLIVIPWSKEEEDKIRKIQKEQEGGGGIAVIRPGKEKMVQRKRPPGNEDVPHLEYKVLKPEVLAPKPQH